MTKNRKKDIRRITEQKRGQIFVMGIVIMVTFGLISSLIILNYLYDDKSENEHIGTYQSGMIDAVIEGDKMLMYVDIIGKLSVNDALLKFSGNGAIVDPSVYDTENIDTENCGRYVYNLWNNDKEECWPTVKKNFGAYVSKEVNDKIKGKNIGYKEYIAYDILYNDEMVYASAKDELIIPVFKNNDYKTDVNIQQYVVQKEQLNIINQPYSGDYKSLQRKLKFIAGTPSCTQLTDKITLIAPTTGLLTSIFDPNRLHPVYKTIRPHRGTDIGAPSGTPVLAVADGKVTKAGVGSGYGNVVYINHNGFETRYAHLTSFSVSSGQVVKKGQEIGKVGNTGVGTGPHLHFELRKGADAIDPLPFVSCVESQTTPRTTVPGICQVKENKDWKITHILPSTPTISGDKKVIIYTTIENPSDSCASIAPRPIFSASGQTDYVFDGEKKFNVYKDNSGKNWLNIVTECIFITDRNKLLSERGKDKCLLLAPTDDSKITYTVKTGAVDANGRIWTGPHMTTTFDVSKPQTQNNPTTGGNGGTLGNPTIQLTTDEKNKIASTKKNLEKLNVLQYAIDMSKSEGVPSEIFLGLITQESGGNDKAGSVAGAYGLTQVMMDIHIARITKECGTKQNFMNDPKCQIRVGLGILKAEYNPKQTIYYQCNINCLQGSKGYQPCSGGGTCGTKCIGPKDLKKYTEWEAALRKYNGGRTSKPPAQGAQTGGCTGWPDYEYVEHVMKLAAGWGYSGTISQSIDYQQIGKDEIHSKGLIGTYSVYPSFNAVALFDLSLVDKLSNFMNYTVNTCRTSSDSRIDCLTKKIDEFNTNISQKYVDNGIFVDLSMNCEESEELEEFYGFIESIEDCATSTDIECQCPINHTTDTIRAIMTGNDESATFAFSDNGNVYNIETAYPFRDVNNKPVVKENINLREFTLFKKQDHMKVGQYSIDECNIVKDKFRLCLDTGYEVPQAFGNNIIYQNVSLKFSINIRDNTPPTQVEHVALFGKKHSKNSIILSFDKNPEGDVAEYIVYLGDSLQDFTQNTTQLKKVLPYRSLDINSGYTTYQSMDIFQDPECVQTPGVDGWYCDFKYTVKLLDGTEQKMSLEENKLYYIENFDRFIYIINGIDQYNKISDMEKFIAVTAVDVDGNEIDNIQENQTIEINKNLMSIVPDDNVEVGFIFIRSLSMVKITNFDRITLTWDKPKIYLDGTKVLSSEVFTYNIYVIDSGCTDLGLCEIINVVPNRIYTSNTETTIINIPTIQGINSHIVVVTGIGDNNKEYTHGIARIVS